VAILKDTTVRRGGVSARYWYDTIKSIAINAGSELRLSFSMSSKGGGYTQVQMEIRPDDFPTILEMMMSVDRQAAMEALSVELTRQIATQPERNAKAIKEAETQARDAIERRAARKHLLKAFGEDDQRERIVLAGIKEIISEIEAKEG
jgi:hypothetical protein